MSQSKPPLILRALPFLGVFCGVLMLVLVLLRWYLGPDPTLTQYPVCTP